MNKSKLIIVLFVLIGLVVYFVSKKKFHEYKTYTSPDKQYELTVYVETNEFKWLSLSSELSSKDTYVALKQNGEILVKSNTLFSNCLFPLAELRIEWLIEKNKIYYNRTDYIDLKAMKISC